MTTVHKIGVREFKANPGRFLRLVRDSNESIDMTIRGEVVARLVPVPKRPTREELETAWRRHQEIGRELSAAWPKGVSAVEAAQDVRRDL